MKCLIVNSNYYQNISNNLKEGAINELKKYDINYHEVIAPGAFEIPSIIKIYANTHKFDAYIALGCVIRGETSHYDIVAQESARGLIDLAINYDLIIANGILTVDNKEQAQYRSNPKEGNKGRWTALTIKTLLNIKHNI